MSVCQNLAEQVLTGELEQKLGIAPRSRAWHARVLLLDDFCMVIPAGLEPASSTFARSRPSIWASRSKYCWSPRQDLNPHTSR
jgi:hypothetical protein